MALTENMKPLIEHDPELHGYIKEEESRQRRSIELIASENFTSYSVMQCLGSCLTNKYSEGQIGNRYYGGNQVIDKIEALCKQRALEAYGLDEEKWGVNVQPHSGSPANFCVYTALLQPHDRIMGLGLTSGGHLTHGFYTGKKKVSATSVYFESLPYQVDDTTGLIDFDDLRAKAKLFLPKLIIAGISAYPRDLELARFREIADEVNAILMCDMAHISGLVAGGVVASNPFDFADIVTSTTHKTLRGPRSGLIFYNKMTIPDAKQRIDTAVFPALQGGPHNHSIAGVATQLKEVMTPEYKEYVKNVIRNSRALGNALMDKGFKLVTDGTDNHMVLIDLRPLDISGSKFEQICEMVDISLNKNTVHGDKSAFNPSGVRIGTPSMTTRGITEEDCVTIAGFLKEVADICTTIQESSGKKLVDFMKAAKECSDILPLQTKINKFAEQLPMPGIKLV